MARQKHSAARKPSRKRPPPAKPTRKARTSASSDGAAREPARARGPEMSESPAPQPAAPDAEQVLIVGIGASAGGLEAFSELLAGLPENPGVAIVFVAHLSPSHESALPELLGARSRLPVVQAGPGAKVQPNHVYVIPPNAEIRIVDGRLELAPRPSDRSQYTPIDQFFRSLAKDAGSAAIAVILSGTSSDGAGGLRDVKGAGGLVFAQTPEEAKYDGMPRAAIATGLVDKVLPARALAQELVEIAHHPRARALQPRRAGDDQEIGDGELARVFALLRKHTGVDFALYKPPTIKRRLQRRMLLQRVESLEQYIHYLERNANEVHALYQDILIHVTGFFREPESFTALTDVVFPKIVENRRGESPIRIWVPGCATGEEAYSVAITLLEFLGDRANSVPIQIFATDVSEQTVEQARTGIYPPSIEGDVSAARLRRFFTKLDGSYRINKLVRDLCIFARQDLTRDPPFSRVDLIVCRNVLIYLGPSLQKKLMNVFHYALRPLGFLMLASAESIGTSTDLFMPVDKTHRIYRRKAIDIAPAVTFPPQFAGEGTGRPHPRQPTRDAGSVQKEANRVILQRFTPPGVLVDGDLQIVEFRGQTGPYLEPAPGDASLSLLKMAREGLLFGLRSAVNAARKSGRPVRREGQQVRSDGDTRTVDVEVVPLPDGAEGYYFLVLFQERPGPALAAEQRKSVSRKRGKAAPESGTIRRLREELAASREYLQSIIQDLEAANEELQSANEEILSSNEELQSTNEELDTAKEELQSTNEELNTVNEELHSRNEELSRVNSDLVNLVASVQIPIVMVTGDLRIRRFTPSAERLLNLIPADVGRPIGQVKPNFDSTDMEQLISEVVENVVTRERVVTDRDGNVYLLRIRPYKNVENRIDGAVLALFDVSSARRGEAELKAAQELAQAMIETARDPLLVLDRELRIQGANRSFVELTGDRGDLRNKPLTELGPEWGSAELLRILSDVLSRPNATEGFLVRRADGPALRLKVHSVRGLDEQPFLILLWAERQE